MRYGRRWQPAGVQPQGRDATNVGTGVAVGDCDRVIAHALEQPPFPSMEEAAAAAVRRVANRNRSRSHRADAANLIAAIAAFAVIATSAAGAGAGATASQQEAPTCSSGVRVRAHAVMSGLRDGVLPQPCHTRLCLPFFLFSRSAYPRIAAVPRCHEGPRLHNIVGVGCTLQRFDEPAFSHSSKRRIATNASPPPPVPSCERGSASRRMYRAMYWRKETEINRKQSR